MARSLYGYQPADFSVAEDAANSDALILAAVTLDIYDAPAGTPQTDLLDKDGVAVTQVTAAAGETIIFEGPDGFDKDLYGTPDSGTTWYRFSPSVDPLVTRVAALEAAGSPAQSLNDLTDASTAGAADKYVLTWNTGTGVATFQSSAVPANTLQGVVITDGSSSASYPDDDFLVFRPVA